MGDLTKSEYITKINELLKSDDLGEVIDEYNEACRQFIKVSKKIRKQMLDEFLAAGGEEQEFNVPVDDMDHRFKELQAIFNQKNKAYQEERKSTLSRNLATKEEIIEELKQLVAEEDRIGMAFKKFNDLREKWKDTGDVPSDSYKELQATYSQQIELFFYNINIYKDLKEYDLKKNLELKQEVIEKIETLLPLQSIRQTEFLLRMYQSEWDELGPTFEADWKVIRDKYWDVVKQVYQKINTHYDQVRSLHQKHLEEKQELIGKVTSILEGEIKDHKSWQEKTREVISLQQDWKKTGFTFKNENEKLWESFRGKCDEFFKKKKAYYDGYKEQLSQIKSKKQELIEQAKSIMENTNWKDTTEEFKKLQRSWKEVGHADQRTENALWKQFKSACDHFFNAKREYYDTLDDRRKENLKLKEALIDEIEAYKTTDNKGENLNNIKAFTKRWKTIQQIPKSELDRVNNRYNKAIDEIFSQMKIDKEERVKLKYQNKIEGLKHQENSDAMIKKERMFLKDKINRLETDILKLEENLGFFKNANHEHPLKRDIEKKIADAKNKADAFRNKLELILSSK